MTYYSCQGVALVATVTSTTEACIGPAVQVACKVAVGSSLDGCRERIKIRYRPSPLALRCMQEDGTTDPDSTCLPVIWDLEDDIRPWLCLPTICMSSELLIGPKENMERMKFTILENLERCSRHLSQ